MELRNSGKEVMKESSFSPFVSVGMPRRWIAVSLLFPVFS
jgi:hypothetical protein